MPHAYHHALSSVKQWGGTVDDYARIHDWFDASKMLTADFRHRALHHAEGIFMAETLFGRTIPSFADWVKAIRPEPWMGRSRVRQKDTGREDS